jgi:peptide subunit release factor 1 (eRF1)
VNQAHYQRHARQTRADFARLVADEIERLVERTGAREVILGGDAVAVPVLRLALAPEIAQIAREPRIPMDLEATKDELWEEVEPLLETTQRQYEQSVTEQLLEAVRADGLGVVGATPTHDALAAGQADVLVIEQDAPLPEAERSELVALASMSDTDVDVIEHDAALDAVGGVGALLRYRIHA